LNLTTLETRRIRSDLIAVFKVLKGRIGWGTVGCGRNGMVGYDRVGSGRLRLGRVE
jgi:hypothetical protein